MKVDRGENPRDDHVWGENPLPQGRLFKRL